MSYSTPQTISNEIWPLVSGLRYKAWAIEDGSATISFETPYQAEKAYFNILEELRASKLALGGDETFDMELSGKTITFYIFQ